MFNHSVSLLTEWFFVVLSIIFVYLCNRLRHNISLVVSIAARLVREKLARKREG